MSKGKVAAVEPAAARVNSLRWTLIGTGHRILEQKFRNL
jgi:hypothetical protein